MLSDHSLHAPGLGQLAMATTLTGDGTNVDPFRAPCDSFQKTSCTVSAFPARLPERTVVE